MTTEIYKGYKLTTKASQNSKGQSTLVYKDGKFVTAAYADKSLESSVVKAKKKVDEFK